MSRFQCGMRRFDKHATDRPMNPSCENEQQKRLSDLLKEREAQDKGQFQPISCEPLPTDSSTTCYTPWKTPTSSLFDTISKYSLLDGKKS
jgi:hypothetical protein